MNGSSKIFTNIFALSAGFWIIFYLYSNLSIKGFIVKRYKQESNLLETIFFREHATFIKFLPDFLSAGFLATHLLMCVWGWRLYGKRKMFRDVSSPEYVTRHFSKKEIILVKRVLISGLIFFIHGVAFFVLKFAWPDAFKP
jgi:hypothetical protein